MILVSVTIGGVVYRVAAEPLDITHGASVVHYDGGLMTYSVQVALSFLAVGGPPSIPLELVLPVDVAALEAAGHLLAGAPIEVAVWEDGSDWASRSVVLSGFARDPEYSEEGEPVTLSAERAAAVAIALVPSVTAIVDGASFPDGVLSLATEELGLYLPVVFGSPGKVGDDWITGSQGVWIDHDPAIVSAGNKDGLELVIAGHRVTGATVMLNTDTTTAGFECVVAHRLNARGQEVAFIDAYADYPGRTVWMSGGAYGLGSVALSSDFQPLPGDLSPVFVGWQGAEGLSPKVGDVIAYMMGRAGVTVDYGRFAAAGALLLGYRIDCVIDTPVKALDWLQANVYPLLPVSVTSGPMGDYPVVWRYDAGAADVVVTLDADADPYISRAGLIKASTGDVANAFTIQWAYSLRTDSYTETLTRDASTCPYCAASERRLGRIEKTLQSRVVYDAVTAASVLGWWSRAYTQPRRRVSYLVPSGYAVQLGDVVRLRDSRVSLDRVCLVSEVQRDGSGVDGVELLIVS